MGQSLKKDSVKCFSYIGSKYPYREYLLTVCKILAAPKTAPIKRKTLKIQYILICSGSDKFLFNNQIILNFLA